MIGRIAVPALRRLFLTRAEVALFDLRDEDTFAQAHPLFAAQLPVDRIALEIESRVPNPRARVVLYDDGEGLVEVGARIFREIGYENVHILEGGLSAWRTAGLELFKDVNSYSKAFGELVEHERRTPSLPPEKLKRLIDDKANLVILDARRFDEYSTMSIPTGVSVPGAELVLRAAALAYGSDTVLVVNCAGRTRSIIGAQSLINAGSPNPVFALRNGTIGWTLAGQSLERGQTRRAPDADPGQLISAQARARKVSYRAGVKHLSLDDLLALEAGSDRTVYRFDVRQPEEYARGHVAHFLNAPGGQLVQETDHYAPVRGARIVLSDDLGPRADMTASWLAQMGWETYVFDGGAGDYRQTDEVPSIPQRPPAGRYKRPYEGTDNKAAAMQAYLEWEYGLVEQLARDATHGFFVI